MAIFGDASRERACLSTKRGYMVKEAKAKGQNERKNRDTQIHHNKQFDVIFFSF